MHIAISGGGTGGHFFPAFTFAKFLKQKGFKVSFIGAKRGIEYRKRELIKEFNPLFLDIKKFKNQNLIAKLVYPFHLLRNLSEIKRHFKSEIPDFSVTFGGYTSIPLGVFTRLNKKPLFVHEQNSVPGMGNRFLSKTAKVVFISFPHSERFFKENKVLLTGLPIRPELKKAKEKLKKEDVLNKLKLENKFTLTILGGSQGAKTLNRIALHLAQTLDIQIIHICGERNYKELKKEYKKLKLLAKVKLFPFYLKMGEIYKITDFAISRAGASTSFELSYFGIPTLFIPYPYAVYNHQYYNARYFVESGGAYLMEEKDLDLTKIELIVKEFLLSDATRKVFSQNMERAFIPNAEKRMWEIIKESI
jgi:UDP-N-acetylglucosamine--N-acetylmuramyl-(pentapeptide) pyrophosphoryl-undecaprenol N-acetylglucosamine transferase